MAASLEQYHFERLGESARSRSSTWPLPEPADPQQPHTQEQQGQLPVGTVVKCEGGLTPECESPIPPQPKSDANKKMRNAWGNMSYAELITQAILSTPEKRLTLSEIYDWIVKNVHYFSDKANSPSTAGWKVSFELVKCLWSILCHSQWRWCKCLEINPWVQYLGVMSNNFGRNLTVHCRGSQLCVVEWVICRRDF